jgi:putative selenium metabolism protein SsnA
MSQLLKSAVVATLDPLTVERADLRVEAGRITERAPRLEPRDGEEVLDLGGKLVMPGMVCGHTHLYSALARGMPAPARSPANFKEILELVWWRLDRALDEETIYWSAVAGALDAARAGTTCLFDHHASPSRIGGSLQTVRAGVEEVGLRGVLCYEVTDRGGPRRRDEGVEENRAFLKSAGGPDARLFRGLVGAHASFTLSDESLEMCAGLMREYGAGLHIHVAEDLCDVEEARKTHRLGVVERLARFGALDRHTILAHGTHLDEREADIARRAGVWFAHNPRSNMNNRVGYAPVRSFGGRMVLGTDGIGADMFEEARYAFFKARDSRLDLGAEAWVAALANCQRMATEAFGFDLMSLTAGAAADLIVLDYHSPTPLTAENLPWHMMFGMTSASVESVMVDGRFVIKGRRSTTDEAHACERAREASARLWAEMEKL